jgi:hypothetical protein
MSGVHELPASWRSFGNCAGSGVDGKHQRYLGSDTMATLRRVNDPRAWRMRRAVATDCKEAIDSIDSLYTSEAWELRDQCVDVWPSTVVKTLGPLADGARGQALVDRQLRKYPGNVSLLKHVSAMCLGLHRLKNRAEEAT